MPWKHLQVAGEVHTPLDEQLLAHSGGPPTGVHRACSEMCAFSCRYTSLLYTAMYTLQRQEPRSQKIASAEDVLQNRCWS